MENFVDAFSSYAAEAWRFTMSHDTKILRRFRDGIPG